MRPWLICVLLAACSDKGAPAQAPPAEPPKHDRPPVTIAVDPGSGMHLDDDVGSRRPEPPPPSRNGGRAIDVTLRSTPTGANAAVDGVPVGTTPTYWAGQVDGREHEFTFELRGFTLARYRFVPVTSGVVHAKLERLENPEEGSSTAPPELVPAGPNPGAVLVNPPPAPMSAKPDAPAPAGPDAATGMGPQP